MVQGGWSKEYKNFSRSVTGDANPKKARSLFAGLQDNGLSAEKLVRSSWT